MVLQRETVYTEDDKAELEECNQKKRKAVENPEELGHRVDSTALVQMVFHCVHFECPEQQSSQKEGGSEEPGTGDPSTPSQQLDPHVLQAPSASSLPPSPGPNSGSPNQQHQ
ncbi:BTB/POZ domain-containing protein 9 [Cricetulus griseus]|nr:BTB/POZ domain-containing protein 9 [Cricetulus griseus]